MYAVALGRTCTALTMVYYHTSNVVPDSSAAFIYVGKDKVESETG